MGQKGGKKEKGKSQKQKTTKHVHEKKAHQTTSMVEVKDSLLGSRLVS